MGCKGVYITGTCSHDVFYFQNEIKVLKQKQHEGAEFSSSFTSEEASHPAILRLSSDGKIALVFVVAEYIYINKNYGYAPIICRPGKKVTLCHSKLSK